METITEKKDKLVLACKETFDQEAGESITKLVNYDLSGLKDLIEFGGFDFLIDNLNTLYEELIKETLISLEGKNHPGGLFENNVEFIDQMFVLKTLIEIFKESKMKCYNIQLKEYPIIHN